MQRVTIDAADRNPHLDADRRDLTGPLGTDGLALNYYRLEPGEWASGLHCHEDQEEVYVVLDGEVTVETLAGGSDDNPTEAVIGADEAVRFAPGEYHACRNEADRSATLFALGAPRDSEVVRIPLDCPDCGRTGLRPATGDDGPVLGCPDCLGEVEATCPDCGSAAMRATVPDDGDAPAGVCQNCGTASTP